MKTAIDMEVQFADAREIAEKNGATVIECSEHESNANWVNVLCVLDGREIVALVTYEDTQTGPALFFAY